MSGAILTVGRVVKPGVVNRKMAVSWSRPVDHRKGICTFSPRGRGKCALNQNTGSGKESGGTVVITNCPKKLSHSILREKFHGAGAKEVDGAAAIKPEVRKQDSRDESRASTLTFLKQRELILKMESILGVRVVLLFKETSEKNCALCHKCHSYNRNIVEFSVCRCLYCGVFFCAISPENLGLTMVKRNFSRGIDCPICYGYHLDVKLGIRECRRRKFVAY